MTFDPNQKNETPDASEISGGAAANAGAGEGPIRDSETAHDAASNAASNADFAPTTGGTAAQDAGPQSESVDSKSEVQSTTDEQPLELDDGYPASSTARSHRSNGRSDTDRVVVPSASQSRPGQHAPSAHQGQATMHQAHSQYPLASNSAPIAPTQPPKKVKGFFSYAKDFTYELFKIIAIVLILRAYVLQASTVDGQSMEPTLHNGDYLLVERFSISLQNLPEVIKGVVPDALIPSIERGDIVVLSSPENGNNELVKRVVAIGGDSFFFADGRIWVNGEFVVEPYLSEDQLRRLGRTSGGNVRHYHESDIFGIPSTYKVSTTELAQATTVEERKKLGITIPKGCLFVMGDNRESSKDSRAWARTEINSDSPGKQEDRTNHLWATVRSVHGRVLMRLRMPWDYDEKYPVFPK